MAGEQTDADIPPELQKPISPTVKIELEEGKTEEVTIPSVNHLFVDIQNYNDQFSMGAIMAKGLISLFHDDDPQSTPPLRYEEENQQITAETLSAIHQETLGKIGLSLEPVYGGATFMGMGEKASSKQMLLNVQDGKRFVPFLHALQPEQVQETGLKPNLESLSGVLAQQVLSHYDLKEPSDETLQLFGNLGNIVGEYKRLGMDEAIKKLDTYLQHARQGDLREFVVIERNGYLSEPGKYFGPADWEKDTSPAGLEERWNGALNTLIMTRDNPKAQELYQQLSPHLSNCVGIAREYIKSHKVEEYYPQEHKDEMDRVLEEVEKRLKSIKTDQNPTSPQQQP